MGRTHERFTAEGLLRKCLARRHVGRFPRSVRDLFWNDRRTSLCVSECRRFLESDCARCAGCVVSRSADAEIRKTMNIEAQNPKQFRMTKSRKPQKKVRDWKFLICFEIRNSDVDC